MIGRNSGRILTAIAALSYLRTEATAQTAQPTKCIAITLFQLNLARRSVVGSPVVSMSWGYA